jgi:hypothetical protein
MVSFYRAVRSARATGVTRRRGRGCFDERNARLQRVSTIVFAPFFSFTCKSRVYSVPLTFYEWSALPSHRLRDTTTARHRRTQAGAML